MRAPVICTGFNMQLGGGKLEVTTLSLRRETRRVTTLSLRREKRRRWYFRIDREMKKILLFVFAMRDKSYYEINLKRIRYQYQLRRNY